MKKVLFVMAIATASMMLQAAEKPVNVVTLGEISMANRTETGTDERGWGQVLPTYFDELASFTNIAAENLSAHQLVESGEYKTLINNIAKKSVLFVQFGDNDLIQENSKLFANTETFQKDLQTIVKYAQKNKIQVILVTPIARNHFSEETGEAIERHGLYAECVRRVAKANNVALIDLNDATFKWVRRLGKEESSQNFTSSELADRDLRLNEQGALEVARIVAEKVKTQKIKPLNKRVINSEPAVRYAK